MTDYLIPTTTSNVNGSSYTADDTIYIEGPRGALQLRNFNGNGDYITITNKPDHQAVITGAGDFALALTNCSYIDLRGDNDSNNTYGIVTQKSTGVGHNVWAWHDPNVSDHIKISYIETKDSGNGITVLYVDNPNTLIYDTFEIHHNYVHDVTYAGMYLGHNTPWSDDNPYLKNFSVHDNIFKDLGAYGITLKGVRADSEVCSIYNNIVIPSDRSSSGGCSTGLIYTSAGSAWHGIGVQYFEGSTYANIYNNWVEKTKGPGLKIGDQKHNVYNNTIVGCGKGDGSAEWDEEGWGHGIITYQSVYDAHIYDNIIIQPTRYGIYAWGTTLSTTMSRNLIGDAGLGEWYENDSGDLTESTGANANTYHTDVADFGFTAWSDDGDYSNDDFTISSHSPYTRARGIMKPQLRFNPIGRRFM